MSSAREKRRNFTTQMMRVLRHHGPMSDALLAYFMKCLGYNPGSAKKKRRELFQNRLVRRGHAAVNRRGQLVQLWEATR